MTSSLQLLRDLIGIYPESLERRDNELKLYPFLLATLAGQNPQLAQDEDDDVSEDQTHDYSVVSNISLSIAYTLFRECPSLAFSALHDTAPR